METISADTLLISFIVVGIIMGIIGVSMAINAHKDFNSKYFDRDEFKFSIYFSIAGLALILVPIVFKVFGLDFDLGINECTCPGGLNASCNVLMKGMENIKPKVPITAIFQM